MFSLGEDNKELGFTKARESVCPLAILGYILLLGS